MRADTLVILDFETTGLSPTMGDRAIEIGAVRLQNGEVVEEFQELMNPGFKVSGFIESYTGISNSLLKNADSCGNVMGRFADFLADDNWVAHNTAFDKRFLDAELKRIKRDYSGLPSCSLLLSRRIFQDADSHKLGELVKHARIHSDGGYHRALYDAQMTAKVWMAMLENVGERYGVFNLSFEQIQKLSKTPKKSVDKLLRRWGS